MIRHEMATAPGTAVDDRVLDGTMTVLTEHGWDGVTLDRVADAAGSSRVTLWRQGITKDVLIDGLLDRLSRDYLTQMWPVLTSTAPPPGRLGEALEALFEVADRHLSLLGISDEVFHWAAYRASSMRDQPLGFMDPFVTILRAGQADGSLRVQGTINDTVDAIFNTACWGYVHLRHRHAWSKRRARRQIIELVVQGSTSREGVSPTGRSAAAEPGRGSRSAPRSDTRRG
jgi:AcrR family transcriptional regulator